MKVAFVGCGYVFDIYMRTLWAYPELEICGLFDIRAERLDVVSRYYKLPRYSSFEELLADPRVEIVINLTSIKSHEAVIRAALEGGKHVYSEKPFTTEIDQSRELFALAASRSLVLTGAPCNLFCDSIGTIWKALTDGAIGKPVLVLAELDDNPAHLMNLEAVRSPTGAPFPYVEELQEGCTVEHIAYHLVWLCAFFGPVTSLTAYSRHLVETKTETLLSPADTPDFSVACLTFAGGVAARVTCSWVAPRDHSFRIVGERGEIHADNVFHDQTAVHLERFSKVSLAARKSYSARRQPLLGRCFGIGGRRQPLMRRWKSHAVEAERGVSRSLKQRFVSELRRREVYAQDKLLGVAEMARALRERRPQPLPPDFLMHVNELTLLVQRAGAGIAIRPSTTFEALKVPADVSSEQHHHLHAYRMRWLERKLGSVVGTLHRS